MGKIRIIKIEISDLQEIMMDVIRKHPSGMSAERLRYILEGKDIPLSPFQVREILQEMTVLKLLKRMKRSRSYIYSVPLMVEFSEPTI